MKKTKLLTLLSASWILAASASSAVVLIDWSTEAGSASSAEGTWNIIGSTATTSLLDTIGADSGIDLSMTGVSTSTSTGQSGSRSVYPSWSPFAANDDRFFTSGSTTASLTLSGLTPGLTYEIQMVSAYSAGNSGKELVKYTMNDGSALGYAIPYNGNDNSRLDYPTNPDHTDADGVAYWTGNLDTGGSSSADWMVEGWLLWNAVADTNGEVVLDVDTTYSSLSRGAYNSMRIEVVPEPATYALLMGLGSLGFILLRRRMGRD